MNKVKLSRKNNAQRAPGLKQLRRQALQRHRPIVTATIGIKPNEKCVWSPKNFRAEGLSKTTVKQQDNLLPGELI
jgi:hypothetical protein